MLPSPLAPTVLPATLSVATAFLPPLAALWARRSLAEPAGRVAVCWLVMAAFGAFNMAWYYLGLPLPSLYSSEIVTAAFPVLLLPPTLRWIGGSARRWQWPALLVWLAVWGVGVVSFHDTREFKSIVESVMSAALCVASVWALAARIHESPSELRRTDWFWILTGHVMYFAINMFRGPLIEALVARHWGALLAVNAAILLLYSLTYVVIARGMLVRPAASSRPRGGVARIAQTA